MNSGPKETSHDECRAALQAIPDLIFQIKDDGTFLNYKGAREELYVPPEQFIGKKVQEVLPEQLARQTLEYMGLALESKKTQIYEYNLTIGDKLKYFEARMLAYEANKVIVVIRDITDRKELELKLEEKINELKLINDTAVGRELKLIEREKEVDGLLRELGRPPKYK